MTWREGRGWLLSLCLAQLAGACAQTINTGSGETHFLGSCETGCGDRLECRGNVCTRACDDDEVCSVLAANATCVEHAGEAEKTCDQLCQRDADCRDVGSGLSCVEGACRVRVDPPDVGGGGSGGSSETPDDGARVCAAGCGNSVCAVTDSCLLATTCGAVDCGGPLIDENACYRGGCESDDDCSGRERCLPIDFRAQGDCDVDADPCGCPRPPQGPGVCSPTTIVGPRGTWQTITLIEDGMPSPFYPTSWTFFPDGSLRKEIPQEAVGEGIPTVSEHQLSGSELTNLGFMVDGADLRQVLTDPNACGMAEDYSVEVELVLDTTTLKQVVTDCTFTGATGRAPFRELLQLAKQF